jgi:hypothetical protein
VYHPIAPEPLSTVCIAVDCMGGDHGATVTLPACREFLRSHANAELLLVGSAAAIEPARDWPRCRLLPASEVVAMDDAIEVALRRKKDSSMRVALSQLKGVDEAASVAHACVSAGNTGALMAGHTRHGQQHADDGAEHDELHHARFGQRIELAHRRQARSSRSGGTEGFRHGNRRIGDFTRPRGLAGHAPASPPAR